MTVFLQIVKIWPKNCMYLLKQAFITLNFSVVKLLPFSNPFLNMPVSVGQASHRESKIILLPLEVRCWYFLRSCLLCSCCAGARLKTYYCGVCCFLNINGTPLQPAVTNFLHSHVLESQAISEAWLQEKILGKKPGG